MENIEIASRDYWFKMVGFLEHNQALIDVQSDGSPKVFFFGDTSRIFDEMSFLTVAEAEKGLTRNGFKCYRKEKEAQNFIACPQPPFSRGEHLNGAIYSSGKFWS